MARRLRNTRACKAERRERITDNQRAKRQHRAHASAQVAESAPVVSEYKARQNMQFRPDGEKQWRMYESARSNPLTLADGVAGAGKTYVAVGTGLELLFSGQVDTFVVTKPIVEIDEKLGAVPGDEKDKTAGQFSNLRKTFCNFIPKSFLEYLEKVGKVQFAVLGLVLGHTFNRSYMLFDEAQMATPEQSRIFLSRMGVESNVVVCGDWREQSFGKPRRGFEDMVARFHDAPGAGYVHFDIEDCKRHDFVKTVIERYRDGRPISERPAQKCNS